ncbi:hypothetical protein M011DRAFT_481121 [Sporormia fimetaria CBS 119925]|uniref:Uncharacterized protein n=1 Tax=Sporormia fimetaria CBS 119925 TaxID=1340428 RepID=A0A6A6UZT1_9PLEO|nr:hypothetical protein M011DRAFT_481121 [Sporormia fimetaria CBS 119925]
MTATPKATNSDSKPTSPLSPSQTFNNRDNIHKTSSSNLEARSHPCGVSKSLIPQKRKLSLSSLERQWSAAGPNSGTPDNVISFEDCEELPPPALDMPTAMDHASSNEYNLEDSLASIHDTQPPVNVFVHHTLLTSQNYISPNRSAENGRRPSPPPAPRPRHRELPANFERGMPDQTAFNLSQKNLSGFDTPPPEPNVPALSPSHSSLAATTNRVAHTPLNRVERRRPQPPRFPRPLTNEEFRNRSRLNLAEVRMFSMMGPDSVWKRTLNLIEEQINRDVTLETAATRRLELIESVAKLDGHMFMVINPAANELWDLRQLVPEKAWWRTVQDMWEEVMEENTRVMEGAEEMIKILEGGG